MLRLAMTLYMIGHSNIEMKALLALLRQHEIALLVDVRSQPYSRHSPQFSREPLQRSLTQNDIAYLHLGAHLGGRPADRTLYLDNGKVNYARLAESSAYLTGIERLLTLAEEQRTALMCAEADYHHCHRYWLITRTLVERGISVNHILPTGELAESFAKEFEAAQPSLF